jgi:hypothetical protein
MRTWAAAAALLAAAVLGLAACEDDGDPLAPADSTITVSANPQTVIIPSGGGAGVTEVVATLRSKNGTRLPDQEITFSTTAGTLDPPAESSLTTDDQGQATSTLITSSAATVTARSGSITGTTQVQTATGNLTTFILNVDPTELTSCQDTLDIEVEVNTSSGDPAPGILVQFETSGELTGTFNPQQTNSGTDGLATSIFTPSATVCQQECTSAGADPNSSGGARNGICTLFIHANDLTGSFSAPPVQIDESIP